jgi:hypothetical protein
MIIVNIEKYGDWDTPYTVVSMVAPQLMGRKDAMKLKREAEELFKDTDNEDGAILFLKAQGFSTCNMVSIAIGSNL